MIVEFITNNQITIGLSLIVVGCIFIIYGLSLLLSDNGDND